MSFQDKLNNIKIVDLDLKEYLVMSLNSDNDNLCNGWDYLKANITEELKQILFTDVYWRLKYNSEKIEHILNQIYDTDTINQLDKSIVKQLGSFVYIYNDLKRDIEKEEAEQKLKEELEREGFKEIGIKLTEKEIKNLSSQEINKRYEDYFKKFDGLKVNCILDVSCIGVLGSFDKKEKKTGKLFYSDYHKALMLIPKRSRTKGFIIKNKCYIKELM